MKTRTCLLLSLFLCGAAFADEAESTIGEANCRVFNPAPGPDEKITWTGGCKDGFATGTGTLQWYFVDTPGTRYVGTLDRGRPHGSGVLFGLNDRYEGEFKNGLADGLGSMVYMTGGRYDGSWKAGKFDGKGTLEYAGSAKRFESAFKDGLPLGSSPVPSPTGAKYAIKEDQAATGTNIRRAEVTGSVPFGKEYSELTPEEKQTVHAMYPALKQGDEPPYPLHGTRSIVRALSAAERKIRIPGRLALFVSVDAEGNAGSVSVTASPSPEMTNAASMLAMLQKYKPAVCDGKPCAMVFPIIFTFRAGR